MINLIFQKKIYFLFTALFLVFLGALIFLYPTGRSFFIINGIHFPLADFFFSYFTHAGDGLVVVVICLIIFLFYRFSAGLAALMGHGMTGLLCFVFKQFVFEAKRPKLFFWNNKMVHYIDGVNVNIEHSFPSGHTATAFFIFTFIVLIMRIENRMAEIVLFLCAALVAWSRVYLAQHFIGDVFAGAILGIICAFGAWMLYFTLRRNRALAKNVFTVFKKRKA